MSEVTSVVEQGQQQEYVGGSSNSELRCKECNVFFNSDKSLEVHLHYHKENLLNQWSQAQQQESNNNNSKAGNHNRHVSVKQESATASADSSEPSSTPSSRDTTSSPQRQQQLQQQQQQQQPANQAYNNFLTPISFPSDTGYALQNMSHVQNMALGICQSFSPSHEDIQNNGGGNGSGSVGGSGYARYHPYQSQHFSSERVTSSSTSPQSPPFQCDKCGAVYENANQLGEHMRTNHSDSPPTAYPAAPQYQQLGNSPQQQDQQQQAHQQFHTSPSHSNQPQQQSNYDYNSGQTTKLDMKQEPEEQTEILDLDSHKVQTHRYEEELIKLQQQQHHQQQELQMQMHPQQVIHQQQQQRLGAHSVNSMLSFWGPPPHTTYDSTGLSTIGPMDGIPPPIVDDRQFIRGQHISVVEPSVHQTSPIIANTQPMPGHQMPAGMLQQPKPPSLANQSWKSNEPRRPKTYNCTACNKWFTSSGHLKRHYNTTLHKNAVKQSNQPDPAHQPISVHHHPGRENNVAHSTSSKGGGALERSPDITSSGSPPNSMAGPSGEATGGLLHTPTTLYNSNSSNSSNSNDSSAAMALAVQQQQGPSSAMHLGSAMVSINSPQQSPMAGHHQQQMGSPSHQVGLQQQQQQLHHLPMSSPGQLQVHHPMSSPISPMHPPPASHMSSLSPMGSSSHPHHMNSSSTITSGTVHPAMVSPTAMGGTTMPHQPYPNAMPPHVTNTTNIPGLLESTNIPLTTIGNEQNQQQQHQQQQQQQPTQEDMLPGFGTFSNHHQRLLPSFTQLGLTGFLGDQPQAINVGGLNSEEDSPQGSKSYDSTGSNYEMYNNSPSRYDMLDMDTIQTNTDGMIIKYEMQNQQPFLSHQFQQTHEYLETNNNNNVPHQIQMKEEINTSTESNVRSNKSRKRKVSQVLKEQQVTSTTSHFTIKKGKYLCISCDKYFQRTCYLTQHNKSFHSGDKPYKCNQCGKRFTIKKQYEDHQEKHKGEKPHKCEKCPKQFNHKTDLRRHICLHTGEKPYSCTICNKGFIRKDHMMKHCETHKKKSNGRHQKENVRARYSTM